MRGLGTALGITVPSGQENDYLITIREKLEQIAAEAGGDAPAPAAPEVPDIGLLRGMIGNDLLAELAARDRGSQEAHPGMAGAESREGPAPVRFQAGRAAGGVGGNDQEAALSAIKSGRTLLDEPNPVAPLVSAAADDLRAKANAVFQAWQAAWQAGQAG